MFWEVVFYYYVLTLNLPRMSRDLVLLNFILTHDIGNDILL